MKKILTTLSLFGLSLNAHAQETNNIQQNDNIKTAIFAGGCFWCSESDFEKVDGVLKVESGYTGGNTTNPTYEEVSAGNTGHIESVKITYDTNIINYEQLLENFWHSIDPTVANRQFCDFGNQYRSAIFYANDIEKSLAEETKKQVADKLNTKIFTDILPASTFYLAEDYHQDYYKKNPIRYHYYRNRCGRDERLEQIWGK
jgi:peptide-methionine (S)-S-oxide reductase